MVLHGGYNFSDHRQLEIHLDNFGKNFAARMRIWSKRFFYKDYWESIEGNKKVIASAWNEGLSSSSNDPMHVLNSAIFSCTSALKSWSGNKRPNFGKDIEWRQKRIEFCHDGSDGVVFKEEIFKLEEEVANLLQQQEVYWRQRSKSLWLQHGDQNTKYFHRKASQRWKRNFISQLVDKDGRVVDSHEEICPTASNYFKQLFQSSNPVDDMIAGILDCIDPKISKEMNQILTSDVSADEIRRALFQMSPSKAPVSDGFTAGFFQRNWDITGPAIAAAGFRRLHPLGIL